jgi:magnesium transporter
MLTKHTHRGLVWIDLESPSQDEIRSVAEEYHLNPLVVHELSAPSLKPKVDLYDNLIYLILHFPRTRRTAKEPDQEIDFILGKKFLITVRYGANETLHLVSKIFDASAVLNKGSFGPHAGFIFFFLLGKLYEALLHELASIGESLRSVEDRIFGGEEREMVLGLSEISRDILYFKRSLSLHRDVLESFEIAGKKFFGEEFTFHLRALTGDYYRVEHAVESNVAFLSELRETNNALLSTKQNEIMRTLTVLAFIALPATTILSLFQIGAVSRPIVGQPGDFWIILLIVGGLVFSLYSFFRYKHWL